MRHRRSDYEAIQAWPTKRAHFAKQDGRIVEVPVGDHGWAVDIQVQIDSGRLRPLIPEDEPVFLIRATDAIGPDTVRAWATLAALSCASAELVAAVEDWADEMERYAAEHGSHVPDAPAWALERDEPAGR